MNLNKLLSTCLWNLYTSSKDCLSVRENTRRKPSPDLGDEVEERGDDGDINGDNDVQYGDDGFMKMRKDSMLYLIYCSLMAENSSCPAVSKISSRAT